VAPVLGSRSWDSLARLGPPPLAAGTVLAIGNHTAGRVLVDQAPVAPLVQDDVVMRVWPGPHLHVFHHDAWHLLTTQRWRVEVGSDRVGTRLHGAALERRGADDLPSQGLVTGAIQVPADGRPIVMMRDHPTTGGYPVIAVVEPRDLDLLAQRQPGEGVRMVPVNTGRTALGTAPGRHAP